jgi:hypothetical protein
MVRLSLENGKRPIDLLEDDNPGQLVRKGKWPQAPAGAGPPDQGGIQPLGASDEECDGPSSLEPPIQLVGQFSAGPSHAFPRQGDDRASLGNSGFEPGSLLGSLGNGRPGPARLPNFLFMNQGVSLEAAKVIVSRLPVVRPEFADGNNGKLTRTFLSAGEPRPPVRSLACRRLCAD